MIRQHLLRFFQVEEHGSTIRRELLGGTTTFLALSYIIFVQPAVLSQAGMDFNSVLYATCLAAAFATLLMGLLANYPVALAPGMGENFFLVYTLCGAAPLGFGMTWQQGLTAMFLAGVLFIVLTLTGVLSRVVHAIPGSLKIGIAAGIGLLITFIGLQYGNLVVTSPSTLVRLGPLDHPLTQVSIAGILVTTGLFCFRVPGAILLGMIFSTLLSFGLGLVRYQGIFSSHIDLSPTFLKFDFRGLWEMNLATASTAILVVFYLALFDTVGTLVGVSQQAGLLQNGRLPRAGRALFSGAAGTTLGAGLGTSTIVCYIESAAGVAEGARTGLANLVTAGLLLTAMFFSPLAQMIGGGVPTSLDAQGNEILRYPMLAPPLILVGSLILKSLKDLNWEDPTEYIPAFLTMVTIPLSFSIATGITVGIVSYAFVKLVTLRGRECPGLIYVCAALLILERLITR